MNRVLLAIGGLLVGLFAILFAAPAMVDWNRYRGIFEEEATRFLGREVRVGGAVNLRLLPVPYVRFEQVRIADTTGTVGRPLFTAEDFTVWLSIGALLSGGVEASDIELRRPVITLVLDGKGGGSWTSVAPTRLPGSYFPARVAFDAVRITDGALAILAPDGSRKTSFEHINGELSAQALEGPYRIAAAFALKGAPRELRLSTAKAGEDGSVRFKGTVRDPGSGVSYSLDGVAKDILRSVAVSGELTARLPLPSALAASAQSGGLFGSPQLRQTGPEFDLRAAFKGDTTGFTLEDLALSFEQAGRPQLATGKARVIWGDRTDVTVTLKSHWLDLDRIAGADTGGSPIELTQGVADAVSRVLDTEGRTEASLTIDQATLGSDVVSNLAVRVEQTDGRLNVKSLTAALPGGARISAAGTFEGKGPRQRYDGRINLRGASLARFAGWAFRGRGVALPARDGAFTISGDLALGPKAIAGRNLAIEVGRNVLTGEASWTAEPSQRIVLALEGSELDLTPLVAPDVDPVRGLRDLVAGLAGVKGVTAPAIGASDADVRLRMDRLVVGPAIFRDAIAELKLAGGSLSLPQLRLTSPDGYMIDLKGDITDVAQPAAKGSLAWHVVADTPAGEAALARAVGLPADLIPGSEDAALIAPLQLAGRLHVGLKGPDTHEFAFDGMMADTRIAGTVRLGAEKSTWRDRPTDFAITLDGKGVPRLLARNTRLAPGSMVQGAPSARLILRGVGSPQAGLVTLAAVEGEGIQAEYRGRASLDDIGALGLDGEMGLSLRDLGRGLAFVGIAARPGLEGPAAGTVRIERSGARTKLTSINVKIAGAEASGELTVEPSDATQRIIGRLKLDRLSLPGVLAFLSTPSSARRSSAPEGPWSETPIDLGVLDDVAGSRLQIETGRLALAPDLDVTEAAIEISVKQGGMELRLSDSKVLGGQVKGTLELEKAAAGARLSVEGSVAGLRLERLGQRGGYGGQSTATGGLTANLKMDGTALSARGLLVALSGSGSLALTQARLNRWSPAAIATASEAILAMRGEVPPGMLQTQLEAAFEASGVGIGSPRLAISIADGALRLAPLTVTAPGGRLTGRASIDLDRVSIDGDWRLEPRNTPQPAGLPARPELPGVTLSYSGPLAKLAALEPKLDLEALEREVAVRKVEREVVELERLRKLDEDRARRDVPRSDATLQGIANPTMQPSGPASAPQAPLAPTDMQPAAAQPGATVPGAQDPTSIAADAVAAQTPPLAEPPKTVDRIPLARPAQAKSPAKGGWRDPFSSLMEGGGN